MGCLGEFESARRVIEHVRKIRDKNAIESRKQEDFVKEFFALILR